MNSSKPLTSLALGAVLAVSLFCSHASRVIAEENYNLPASAEETSPLKTGDKAPSFSVMDVDGNAYDFEVLGVQGISTESECGLQRINSLVDFLVERDIKAVFVESSVPRKNIEALVDGARSRQQTVTIGGELFSDAMGAAMGGLAGIVTSAVLFARRNHELQYATPRRVQWDLAKSRLVF